MPYLLIDIVTIVSVVFALLLSGAATVLGNFVAKLVGELPVVGSLISGVIKAAINDAINWLVGNQAPTFKSIAELIVDHGTIHATTINNTVNAISSNVDRISNVKNVVVPDAVNSANTFTVQKFDTAESDLKQAEQSLQNNINMAEGNITALRSYIDGPFTQELENDITNGDNTAEADAKSYTDEQIATLTREMNADLANVVSNLDILNTAVSTTLPADIAQVAAQDQASISAARQDEMAALQTAINTIDAQISTAIANNANAEASALQGVQSGLQNQLNNLTSVVSIEQANIGVIQQDVGITIPATIAAVGAAVVAITTEFDNCAVTTCAGPNNYQNLLSDLLGGLDLVDMATFLGTAINSPLAAAASFAAVGNDLFQGAETLVESLLAI